MNFNFNFNSNSNSSKCKLGKFFIVSTPIGNLKDITFRAIEVLNSSDIILCEDTRNSIKLLNHYNISKKLISYHKFSNIEKDERIYKMLLEGKNISLISDAGTPLIADPGNRLVKFLYSKGIKIESLPGACSIINALVLSGVNTENFYFAGWMSRKNEERINNFINFLKIAKVLVFLESPNRLKQSLIDIYEGALLKYSDNLEKLKSEFEKIEKSDNPQKNKKLTKFYDQELKNFSYLDPKNISISIVREMTKIHEEVIKGNFLEINKILEEREIKGEIVLIFER